MQTKSKNTNNIRMKIVNNNPAKRAGSNRLSITVNSNDWRVDNTSISMSIRDATALRNFLNEALPPEDSE